MKFITNRRTVVAGLGATLAAPFLARGALAQGSFEGRQLVSSGFGGSTQDIIQAAVFDPFSAATGAETVQVPLQSAAALARMKAEAANPQIDMFQFSGGQEVVAKAEGLTQPMEGVSRLAQIPEGLKDPDGHWAAWAVIAEGIIYRTDKISEPPTSYLDLLRPEYRGHVAFPVITNGYGMDFLVMLARAHGGGEDNIDPGFEAMREIRDQTIFRAASDLPALFGQGDIWIMPYDTGNTYKTQQAGLPVAFATPKEGSPAVFITTCVAKGARNADVAGGVIDQMLSPESQVAIAQGMRWTPTNPETELPAELDAEIPSVDQLTLLDRETINARRDEWTERWNREIAG